MVISEISFAQDVKKICSLIINNVNVVLFGAELLSYSLLVVLSKLMQDISSRSGEISSIL